MRHLFGPNGKPETESYAEAIETPAADYRFRVRVAKTDWVGYIADCACAIDYDNFKSAVAARQGPARASVYGEVWASLRRPHRQS
ncbi:MAG: hypothetical protein H0U12_01150 [Thermoleophilaceae bacterium]|nr:hypothetical protein [Thermoleophilaceae bacterium]